MIFSCSIIPSTICVDDLFGDYVDLETGTVHRSKGTKSNGDDDDMEDDDNGDKSDTDEESGDESTKEGGRSQSRVHSYLHSWWILLANRLHFCLPFIILFYSLLLLVDNVIGDI